MLTRAARFITPPTALGIGTPNALSLRKMRVLLVDDDSLTLNVGRRILGKLGCTVSVALNGEQAAEACRRELFDVVLMDGRMPVMDGPRAIALIRQLPGEAGNVPILCTSSCEETAKRCLAAGADGFLEKPFEPRATRAALQQVRLSLPVSAAGRGDARC